MKNMKVTLEEEEKVCKETFQNLPTKVTAAKGGMQGTMTVSNYGDFPGDAWDRNLPDNAGDMGSIPGLGRFYMPWSN